MKENKIQLLLGLFVYIIYFVTLFPGIFTKTNNYYVMASSNWQDTAMHTEIIESITQGNFPPQAPYYSGRPLDYYYFADFHTAILEKLYGQFFPRILVYDNPFFAAIFAMTLYALAYVFIKSKFYASLASLIGVFSGSFMFIYFFRDLGKSQNIRDLILNNSYTMEYGKLFQTVPMADYFLQNRPMMVGLSIVAAVFILFIIGLRKRSLPEILLAGILTGSLIKFQFFGVLAGFIVAVLSWLVCFRFQNRKFMGRAMLSFVLPAFFSSAYFYSGRLQAG